MIIKVAHAIARKGGTHYRARAYVDQNGKHSFSIAIGDTAQEATDEAVEHIRKMYRRDDLTPPTEVQDCGRHAAAIVDNHLF